MTNPVVWLRDLQRVSDPSLDDFEIFLAEMHKMNDNNDQKLNTVMNYMTNFLRGLNELVRANSNRMNANRRAAGWRLPDEQNTSEIAWSRQRPGLEA
jgi:hypothetical protein